MTPNLFIATPCYGAGIHAAYSLSLLQTKDALRAAGVSHTIQFEPGDSLVQRARNVLVARFLETECTHLLFIDGDIEWKPDDVFRLLSATTHPQIEVACGIYPRKSREVSFPVNFAIDADNCLTWHTETGCVEVKDAPTGFLMIRREVIERMIAAYPERKCQFREESRGQEYSLFDCFIDPATGHYLSEDFGWSRLYQKIGGRIWADPEISLAHYGQFKFTGSIKSLFADRPKRAQDIQGWMTDEELAFLSGAAALSNSVAEVGSWKGRSTWALLEACPGPVYAVDHWQGSRGELGPKGAHVEAAGGDVFALFWANVGHFPNLQVVRKASAEASGDVPPVDMVFIDGGHTYDEVVADIRTWRTHARRLLCGHDHNWPEVARAVADELGAVRVTGSIWIKPL